GSWAVMAVIYYAAMISHSGLIRIFPSSDSFLTKLKCRRIISNKNINSIYDFSEIGPYLDESLITVFENSSQNI
ncbi:hypothetical protein NO989_18395, partial [Alteromonas sp. DY56-G5]